MPDATPAAPDATPPTDPVARLATVDDQTTRTLRDVLHLIADRLEPMPLILDRLDRIERRMEEDKLDNAREKGLRVAPPPDTNEVKLKEAEERAAWRQGIMDVGAWLRTNADALIANNYFRTAIITAGATVGPVFLTWLVKRLGGTP